jgi:hypothetical protein
LKKEPVELNEKSVNKCKDSLDSFDKDLIRRVVVGFFSKNEYVSIRKLRVTLEKNHSLKLSKYKLWKTLHELGFRYAKINGNKKALVERKDLVNKRIICLRTIKQKRNVIALFTWTKLGLITTIQHPISGHHLTLQMPEKFPLIKDKDL